MARSFSMVDGGAGWGTPAPVAAPAPAPAPARAPMGLYDPSKVAALVSAQAPGADGRTVLGAGFLGALNTLTGGSVSGAGQQAARSIVNGADSFQTIDSYWTPGTYSANGQTLNLNLWGTDSNPGFATEADYRAKLAAAGLDPTKTYGTLGLQNPTGSASDWLRPIYEIGADGSAKPVAVSNSYSNGGAWVGGLRDWLKNLGIAAATIATVGSFAAAGGASAAGTGAATGAEAAGTAASAATVDAGAGALTINGAAASGFGSGLGIEGFGAGLGSTISATGAGSTGIFGSLGAWGTAATTAADLTFAGQGISLGSSLGSSLASTVSDAVKAVSTTTAATPAAVAPAAVDAGAGAGSWGAGSVLKGIGQAAGLVGTVAGAAGAVGGLGKGNAFPSSSGTATGPQMAAQQQSQTWLLILAAAAGAYLLS